MNSPIINSVHDQNIFLNTISDGVICVDSERAIISANISSLNILGQTEDVLLGNKFEEVVNLQINGSEATFETSPVYKSQQKNGIYNTSSEPKLSITMGRSDRSILPVSLTVIPTSNTDNEIAYIIVFHDSTADEKIDRAKSEFIALVSHQLRTPINIISWYVEKLVNGKHGELNDTQKEYLNEVASSNKRVVDLVQAIVNVSRTDLNRVKHKHEPIMLNATLNKDIELLRPVAVEKNISLAAYGNESDLPINDSDQELVSVCIRNVLLNALRYTQDGGEITVTVEHRNNGEPYAGFTPDVNGYVVSIKDNGIGIPDEEKSHIFTKLYRATNVQTLDVTGVGLGLYIAQSFIQELGGHIWFESEVRIGSTFYIFIPSDSKNSL